MAHGDMKDWRVGEDGRPYRNWAEPGTEADRLQLRLRFRPRLTAGVGAQQLYQ
jgi:hypothetical protein